MSELVLKAFKQKKFCLFQSIYKNYILDIPKVIVAKKTKPQLLFKYDEWEYNPNITDWENTITGERLSGYKIPNELKAILENNINTTLN